MANEFAKRHPADSWFWFVFLVAGIAAILLGFREPVERRFTGAAAYPAPWALVIHVWSFCAWMVLLACQAILVSRRRLRLHRLLGLSLLLLLPVMVWSGFAAEAHSQRFWAPRLPDHVRNYVLPLTQVGGFTFAAVAAFLLRRNPPAHKRMIFLATSMILAAAYGRVFGPWIDDTFPPGVLTDLFSFHGGFFLLAAAGMGYDVATRGRVHPVYAIVVPLTLLVQFASVLIARADWWPDVARAILGIG